MHTDSERLNTWMRERGFNYRTLAEVTGDTYSLIYMMAKGQRDVNDAFKWRFASAFGWDEAQRVFPVEEQQLVEA